ncbi:hypothetical protein NEOLEDRAFT_684180 [Neolentinus lepideus HHB14362 ss-1]|uniref:Uncharacterized protein n=1 Tax=Neolentinus lepideus HHB14362 ss-1 TaxID=1314782 RepID=A0A165V021_9AGAM|nr:hypothetical protein NEOLEDRAFT_684180 [Neolentinus lepideus HHB14362 ss-1]
MTLSVHVTLISRSLTSYIPHRSDSVRTIMFRRTLTGQHRILHLCRRYVTSTTSDALILHHLLNIIRWNLELVYPNNREEVCATRHGERDRMVTAH